MRRLGEMPDIWFPDVAYLPGNTPRHPDDAFAALRASVVPGMDAGALISTAAWRAGHVYLAAGFFWEAHEMLEPVWLALPQNSAERAVVQAVIQLANAALKLLMGRETAARRICDLAEALLPVAGPMRPMGVCPDALRVVLQEIRDGRVPNGENLSNIMHQTPPVV